MLIPPRDIQPLKEGSPAPMSHPLASHTPGPAWDWPALGGPWGRVSCCPQGMFPILEQQVNITSQRSANLGCKTASEKQIQPSHTYCLLFKLSSQNPGMEVLPKGGYSTCKSCPLDPKRLSIQTTFHTTPMQHAFLSRKLSNGSY